MRFDSRLPDSVTIDGIEYQINTGFRTSIEFELLVQEEIEEELLLQKMLQLYYGNRIPPDVLQAVEKALWFYAGGNLEQNNTKHVERSRPYSFEYDWDYIYAAFLEQFGVDLQDTEMHWWKFRAMFASLNDKVRFSEIIGYRTVKLDSKMPKQQKEFYKKMKKIYALPKNNVEQQRLDEIRERLRRGESIEEVL